MMKIIQLEFDISGYYSAVLTYCLDCKKSKLTKLNKFYNAVFKLFTKLSLFSY